MVRKTPIPNAYGAVNRRAMTKSPRKAPAPKQWGPRPQLSAEMQAKIGEQLREMYDGIIEEGVPDRFVELLSKLDTPKDDQR